jgi:hypothetical protein
VPPQPVFPPPGDQQQPQYDQPGYGQPQYDQAQYQYGQAQYGQAQYGQAQYGQPGYGQPEYPQGAAFLGSPQPPKKSKVVPIVLISLAVLLVLCLGGGTAVFIAVRNKATDVVSAAKGAASPAPSVATPSATPVDEPTAKITVIEPKKLGGRPRLTDRKFSSLAKNLKSDLAADVPDATHTVSGVYGTAGKRNLVVMAAAAAPFDDPQAELDGMFDGTGVSGNKITSITRIDSGPLGGAANCGKALQDGVRMVLCSWVDSGSLGMLTFFFQSFAKVKAEFPKLRAQIEQKSS